VIDIEEAAGVYRRIWKCIGCGKETLFDHREQEEDRRRLQLVHHSLVSASAAGRRRAH
jgi:hypothetical protein